MLEIYFCMLKAVHTLLAPLKTESEQLLPDSFLCSVATLTVSFLTWKCRFRFFALWLLILAELFWEFLSLCRQLLKTMNITRVWHCKVRVSSLQYIYSPTRYTAVAQLVEALRYKSEGRGFDSRWCHWNFSLTLSFRPHCGPGVDSASNRNEYQEYFLGVKSGRCVGLIILPPSCADCLGIWEPQPTGTLRDFPGP